jgi:hypothetical protein
LKEHFFEHLAKVSEHGQIIVVENIDLPANIGSLANVEVFTGDPNNGRIGLFPYVAPVSCKRTAFRVGYLSFCHSALVTTLTPVMRFPLIFPKG